MEHEYLVSVIMPCYNVENYIDETLDTLVNQSLSSIEIICIDDGSTDGTLKHLQDYAEKYQQIKVVSETNHRQGYERNQGIAMAKGKYIYYMDSDDLLSENCLELISGRMEQEELDLAFFEADSFYETEELEEEFGEFKTLYHRDNEYPDALKGTEMYVTLRQNRDMIVSPCLQLASREMILKNELRFNEELPMLEDNIYTMRCILAAQKVRCFKDVLYQRRVRGASTMTQKRLDDKVYSFGIVLKDILGESEKYMDIPEVHETILAHGLSIVRQMGQVYQTENISGNRQVADRIRNYQAADLLPMILLLDQKYQDVMRDRKEKLEKVWAEKSEINAKLQQTYKEKSERGEQINELKEKLNGSRERIQELKDKLTSQKQTSAELRDKVKATRKEKKQLASELEQLKSHTLIKVAMKLRGLK